MGFQERPYYREKQSFGPGSGGLGGISLPRLPVAVKYLLIINVAVFIMQSFYDHAMINAFAAGPEPLQLWRLLTFQFLHGGVTHLLFNMIALYFLGRHLETRWGTASFLRFYLICGAVGGALYIIATQSGLMSTRPLIGASGGVLGLLVACAILFPQIRILVMFMFPMSIRTAAIIFAVMYPLLIIRGDNAGGNLCHLGGMATGFLWITARPYLSSRQRKVSQVSRQHRSQDRAKLQFEVDRILAKVHQQGIQSLTRREKQTLKDATDQQQKTL